MNEGLELLKACKEFLDPFLIGKDDFMPILPDIYEALKGRPDLPISLYDGKYDYCASGITEAHGERFTYAPITIGISLGKAWFFYYANGKYNIDQDIEKHSCNDDDCDDDDDYEDDYYDDDYYDDDYYDDDYDNYNEIELTREKYDQTQNAIELLYYLSTLVDGDDSEQLEEAASFLRDILDIAIITEEVEV